MATSAFYKVNDFVEQVGLKNHNLNTDLLRVFLTNEQPLATDTVKGDMVEISAGGSYVALGEDIQNLYSEASGIGTMTATDVTWATGPFGPFRFAVIYNDSGATKYLVGWYDYGTSITPGTGESFKVDFGASVLTLQ